MILGCWPPLPSGGWPSGGQLARPLRGWPHARPDHPLPSGCWPGAVRRRLGCRPPGCRPPGGQQPRGWPRGRPPDHPGCRPLGGCPGQLAPGGRPPDRFLVGPAGLVGPTDKTFCQLPGVGPSRGCPVPRGCRHEVARRTPITRPPGGWEVGGRPLPVGPFLVAVRCRPVPRCPVPRGGRPSELVAVRPSRGCPESPGCSLPVGPSAGLLVGGLPGAVLRFGCPGFSLRWRVGFPGVGGLMRVLNVFGNPPYTCHLFVGGVWFVRLRH